MIVEILSLGSFRNHARIYHEERRIISTTFTKPRIMFIQQDIELDPGQALLFSRAESARNTCNDN